YASERGRGERLRYPESHRRYALRPAGQALRLDHEPGAGEGRGRGGHAHPAQGLDGPLAPDDLARPAGLSCPQARLRRVRAGPALPLLRRGSHRSGGGREAGQIRPVLVTPGEPVSAGTVSAGTVSAGTVSAGTVSAGTVPEWLRKLAAAAETMEIHP